MILLSHGKFGALHHQHPGHEKEEHGYQRSEGDWRNQVYDGCKQADDVGV